MKKSILLSCFSVLISLTACQNKASENAACSDIDTVITVIEDQNIIAPVWTFSGEFDMTYGAYRFEVNAIPDFGYHDSVHIRITSDAAVLTDTTKECTQIEEVLVRDLDADDFPEIYLLERGEGSGGFLLVDMYEANGGPLSTGDLDKLYGCHKLSFTSEEVIHEQWLETPNGCCDYAGIEYTYFKLVDNSFKFVRREEWIYNDTSIVNRSFVGE